MMIKTIILAAVTQSAYFQIMYECLLRGVKLCGTDKASSITGDTIVTAIEIDGYLHPIFLSRESLDHPDECVEVIVEFAKANRTYYKRAEMAQWN